MRPRKGVNVASLVGSPEDEPSRPNLRLRVIGLTVLVLFGILILRLWTLQVIDGKTYAAAVTRNLVRVVSVPAPRGEIVDRAGTVLVSNLPQEQILLSQVEVTENPGIVGQVAALVVRRRGRSNRPSRTPNSAPTSRCRWPPTCRPTRCSTCRPTRPSSPA